VHASSALRPRENSVTRARRRCLHICVDLSPPASNFVFLRSFTSLHERTSQHEKTHGLSPPGSLLLVRNVRQAQGSGRRRASSSSTSAAAPSTLIAPADRQVTSLLVDGGPPEAAPRFAALLDHARHRPHRLHRRHALPHRSHLAASRAADGGTRRRAVAFDNGDGADVLTPPGTRPHNAAPTSPTNYVATRRAAGVAARFSRAR
jgi:hypothetical protein